MRTVEDVCKVIDISELGRFLAVMVQVTLSDLFAIADEVALRPSEYEKADVERWLERARELDQQTGEVCSLLLIYLRGFGEDALVRRMFGDCVLVRGRLLELSDTLRSFGTMLAGGRVRLGGNRYGWDRDVGLGFALGDAAIRVNGLKRDVTGVLPMVSECRLDEDERYFERLVVEAKVLDEMAGEEAPTESSKAVQGLCKEGLVLVKKGRHHTLKSYFELIYAVDEDALVRTVEWVRERENEAFALVAARKKQAVPGV